MATIEQMYQALERADAAGEVEDARQIAAMIREAQAGGATQQAPSSVPAAVPRTGSGETDPFAAAARTPDMRRLAQAEASAGQTWDAARTTASGLAEGAKQALAGVAQMGSRLVERFRPSGGTPLSDAVTEAENLRQVTSLGEAVEQGIDPAAREMWSTLPAFAVPNLGAAAVLKAWKPTTVLLGSAKDAAMAGLGGLFMFSKEKENLTQAAIEAGLGGAAGLTVSGMDKLTAGARNQVGRWLLDSMSTGRTQASVDASRAVLPEVDFTLGQLVGDPRVIAMEGRAFNSDHVKFLADQTESFVNGFARVMREDITAGTGAVDPALMSRAKDQFDSRILAQRIQREKAYTSGMSRAMALPGADERVATPTFVEALDNLAADNANALRGSPVLKEYVNSVQKARQVAPEDAPRIILPGQAAMSPVGQASTVQDLTARQLADVIRGVNQAADSDDPIQRAVARKLKDALSSDISNIPVDERTGEALREVIATNATYRLMSAEIDGAATSAAYKLLNVDDFDAGAEQLTAKFAELPKSAQLKARQYMADNTPELLEQIRSQYINDAVRAARANTPAADAPLSLGQLDEFLFQKGGDIRASGLWSGKELAKIEGVREGLRVIANNRPVLAKGVGTQILPEDIAINLVSGSTEFGARQVARILTSSKASELFTNPAIQKELTNISRATSGSPKDMAARAALHTLLSGIEAAQTDYEQLLEKYQAAQGAQQ